MVFNNLTPEQMKRVQVCKTPEELLAFVNEEGFELSDKELEAVPEFSSWDAMDEEIIDSEDCITLTYTIGTD